MRNVHLKKQQHRTCVFQKFTKYVGLLCIFDQSSILTSRPGRYKLRAKQIRLKLNSTAFSIRCNFFFQGLVVELRTLKLHISYKLRQRIKTSRRNPPPMSCLTKIRWIISEKNRMDKYDLRIKRSFEERLNKKVKDGLHVNGKRLATYVTLRRRKFSCYPVLKPLKVGTHNVTAYRNAVTLQVFDTIRSYELNFQPVPHDVTVSCQRYTVGSPVCYGSPSDVFAASNDFVYLCTLKNKRRHVERPHPLR